MVSKLLEQKKIKSKKTLVYDQIKEEIINNRIAPGTPLIERQICAALKTSRTPVREALQRLAADGLVDIIPRRGVIVSDITTDDLYDIYDIRIVLEILAVKRCIERITDQGIMQMQQILEGMRDSLEKKEFKQFILYDRSFHSLIVDIADNPRLKKILKNMNDHIERITFLIYGDEQRMLQSISQHTNVFEAISNRDSGKGEKAIQDHLNSTILYHEAQLKRRHGFISIINQP
ncbi:MAG: GntR family transcriptional regulator [Bacillota bacterium]|nr:GntR family transcriptional regulator [Bacillota bacterium]MDW7677704.1 GntR family transcriptional regulator [Bacillota bacterium]